MVLGFILRPILKCICEPICDALCIELYRCVGRLCPVCLCCVCLNDANANQFPDRTVELYCGLYVGQTQRLRSRVPHGQGTLTYKEDGRVYQGSFKDGAPHGEGTLQYPDGGDRYEGSFKEGEMHGYNLFISKTGAGFEALWKKGVLTMKPVMKVVYLDESVYEGGIDERGVRNGEGTFTSHSDNSVYVGNWVNDVKHGHGKFTMPSGDSYEGDWVQDKKHGQGLFIFGEGGSYEGGFENNLKHGKGTFITKEGKVKKGVWHRGKKVNPSKRNPETAGSFTTPEAASEVADYYDQSAASTDGYDASFSSFNPMLAGGAPHHQA